MNELYSEPSLVLSASIVSSATLSCLAALVGPTASERGSSNALVFNLRACIASSAPMSLGNNLAFLPNVNAAPSNSTPAANPADSYTFFFQRTSGSSPGLVAHGISHPNQLFKVPAKLSSVLE